MSRDLFKWIRFPNGAFTRALNSVAGRVAEALGLTGTFKTTLFSGSQWLSVADDPALTLGADDFAFDFWLNWGGAIANTYLVTQGDNGSGQTAFRIQVSSGLLRFSYSADGTAIVDLNATGVVWAINTNYHISIRRNGNNLEFKIDGVAKGTGDLTGITIHNSTAPILIGRLGGYEPLKYSGSLATYRMFSGVTAGELTELENSLKGLGQLSTGLEAKLKLDIPMHAGVDSGQEFVDQSDNAITITPTGTPTLTGADLEFDA